METRGIVLSATLAILSACQHEAARPTLGPPPTLPKSGARVRRPPAPPEWFWEPIELTRSELKPIDTPIPEATLLRLEGATRLWDDLGDPGRERVLRDGVVVVGATPGAPHRQMGAFYNDLREQRVPYVVTLDALFGIVHLALERALAEVEELELGPALDHFLARMETRLTAEQAGSGVELAEGYRVARGIIAVARSLSNPTQVSAPDLASVVAQEKAKIEAHGGLSPSPLLGVPIDYSRFVVPTGTPRPSSFLALAWLGAAPLSVVARSEAAGAPVDVAQARRNVRAAMVLARLLDRDVDAQIHDAYVRISRLLAFVWGSPDDVSLTELGDVAEAAGIDLAKPDEIANVARVDKLRRKLVRVPATFDASGGYGRAGTSVRVFGGHASADSTALQLLVGGPTGRALDNAKPEHARAGKRALPSTLDLAAWLGAPEARALLKETGADAFESYEAALASVVRTRPSEEGVGLHGSVHGSLVEALVAWASPTRTPTGVATVPAERRRVESILSAWTLARHTGQPLTRTRPTQVVHAKELRVSGAALPAYVEPAPEPIAIMVGTVRQLRRGLVALGKLPESSAAHALLLDIEDLLKSALRIAERLAHGESLTNDDATMLAAFPARVAGYEEHALTTGPVDVVVHSDPIAQRVLVSATGAIEPAYLVVRDPSKEGLVLAVGAHQSHHQLVDDRRTHPTAATDAGWRARLKAKSAANETGRASWVASFRLDGSNKEKPR